MRVVFSALLVLFLGLLQPALAEPQMLESHIQVQVTGMVRRPGLYRLLQGARQADAIQVAGGLKPGADVENLSLAAGLQDGETLEVSKQGTAVSAAANPMSPAPRRRPQGTLALSGGPARLDLNHATADQLDTLPGVGPTLANDILSYRRAHGRFSSLDELREIAGIGERRFARLKPFLKI